MDPDAGFDARLQAGGVAFDDRDAELLRAIDEEGSLNAAAAALERSYSRSHERLSELEAAFGTLVERRRGGQGGGGSELTDRARDLLARLDRLESGLSGIAAAEKTVLSGTVVERDGELATVETPVGRVRALVPTDPTDVELTIREDAVTLNDPADAPAAEATSARNRFEGTVGDLRRGRSVARVWVGVAPDESFVALVTNESLGRLGLSDGDPVVASFKATATRGVPGER
jgi:molybdate transport system regulatory protein